MTIEERVEALEMAVALLIERVEAQVEAAGTSLEEAHSHTVARVKAAKERGGLAS